MNDGSVERYCPTEASYACSFGHKSEVNDNDMEELLNVLTVNELSEILKILKKVRISFSF